MEFRFHGRGVRLLGTLAILIPLVALVATLLPCRNHDAQILLRTVDAVGYEILGRAFVFLDG